jgi:hypothetical protein
MKNIYELFLDIKSDLLGLYLDGKILALGISLGGILLFIKTYIFADAKFLVWLIIVILLDSIAKLYNLWFVKKQKPSLKLLLDGFLNKSLRYTIYLIGCYALVNFEVDGAKVAFLQSFNVFLYGILIIKEVNSITKSLGIGLPKPIADIINSKFELDGESKMRTLDGEPEPPKPKE